MKCNQNCLECERPTCIHDTEDIEEYINDAVRRKRAAYYQKNREQILTKQRQRDKVRDRKYKEYYQKNKNRILEANKKRYYENREERLQKLREYYQEHKEEIQQRRRAQRVNSSRKNQSSTGEP